MPGTNLTRAEAAERAELLRVQSYQVELDLTTGPETFRSATRIAFQCERPGAATFVDLIAPRVHEIVLNGRRLDPSAVYVDSRIELDDLAADNLLEVVADCAYVNTGEGLHRATDPADGSVYLYTHFEVPDARRMFASFEQPDLKATWQLTVTAPADWQVASCSPTPEPVPAGEGSARWEFAATPPISTYITALVAGPYHVVRDRHTVSGKEIPLGLYCRASLAQYLDPDEIFEVTKQGFDFFSSTFDFPYPFEKYDQLFVPEFNAGAMENAGCVTFRDEFVFRSKVTDTARQDRADVILHEMAHMWFGDLVTMRWWDDLWLNESFATYASNVALSRATRWTEAWTSFINSWKAYGYAQDQLPSTHPIVGDMPELSQVWANFDGIAYAKGASVLKQLAAYVGFEEFFAGLRHYFKRFAWGNTTLADLLSALEESSGRDMTAWAAQWLNTAGVNTLRPELTVNADGVITSFAVLQEAHPDWPTLRTHRIAIGIYHQLSSGALTRRHRVELDVAGPRTEVPELSGVARGDLVLLNDDDLTFAKIRLDPVSLATVVRSVAEIDSSIARALSWAAAWDMCRDGEMPARAYVAMLVGGIGAEQDISVVDSLLGRRAVSAIDEYADPAWRREGRRRIAATMRELMDRAEPGSDHQLAWVRGLVWSAIDEPDVEFVRGLLDGSATVPGLAVDEDLRWRIVTRLAAGGLAGPEQIADELARDKTAMGEEKATTARAALSLPDSKATAWRQVLGEVEVTNAIQTAAAIGFIQADQRDVLEPYSDAYFDSIVDFFGRASATAGLYVTQLVYPRQRIEQSTLDRTDRFLASPDLPPALARQILEARDGVARALRAQACDVAAGQSGGPAG
ncbi:MAG TPA: aminopeptidase N [Actinomycetes bacterium]|nr:aminopeptidase N [Actinomycetes bacterium]